MAIKCVPTSIYEMEISEGRKGFFFIVDSKAKLYPGAKKIATVTGAVKNSKNKEKRIFLECETNKGNFIVYNDKSASKV